MEKISVIIPVYNVERFVMQSVYSVINQTYTNLEIILVDDGSTDNSGKMCDELAKIDNRIKVIHKKNGGLSDARNVALDIVTGKYIAFLDSDDCIDSTFYEYLYNLIKKDDYDIAECNFLRIPEEEIDNFQKFLDEANQKDEILIKEESKFDALRCLYGRHVKPYVNRVVVWNKLYKAELFDGIRYPLGKYFEDECTIFKVLDKINKMICSTKILHAYMQTKNSIMRRDVKQKQIEDTFYAFESSMAYFENNSYIKAKVMRRYLEYCLELFWKVEKGLEEESLKQEKYQIIIVAFTNFFEKNIDFIVENTPEKEELEIMEVIKNAYKNINSKETNITDFSKEISNMQKY